MTQFTEQNRDKPMWHTIAFHDVPMFRALALALDDAQDHGAKFAIFSADRRDGVIERFNAKYHTNLHGQQYLYDHQGQPGFYAADSPNTTSHCLFSDGNPVYQDNGHHIPAGQRIPSYMLGIDACDAGSANDCSRLVRTLEGGIRSRVRIRAPARRTTWSSPGTRSRRSGSATGSPRTLRKERSDFRQPTVAHAFLPLRLCTCAHCRDASLALSRRTRTQPGQRAPSI